MKIRITSLFIVLVLSLNGCSSGPEPSPASGSTQVNIALGQSVAVGALTAAGTIPTSVKSFSVTAYDAAGKLVGGPVIVTLPQTTATLDVLNGTRITFQLLAYDAGAAFGKVIYRGTSAPQHLSGQNLSVPITVNLNISITASALKTSQGGSIQLRGFVAGTTPVATSPLLWKVNGGILGAASANGGSITWTSPNTLAAVGQTYAITATIDPNVNVDQAQSIVGNVNVLVVPQVDLYGFSMDGNTFSVNGVTASVDVYGKASASTATAGVALNISFIFRDYTGNGAGIYTSGFKFDIREAFGNRRAIGLISPVNIVTTVGGQVSVTVPANALLTYTGTSAAGTMLNGTSTNVLANTITTSVGGVITLDANALLQTIANSSIANMNIFSTVGEFNYELGFDTIHMGHQNTTATGMDRLFEIGINTNTRGLKGQLFIQ